jgi:hypothetical protein
MCALLKVTDESANNDCIVEIYDNSC